LVNDFMAVQPAVSCPHGKTMNRGVCPKCGSGEIYRGASTDGEGLSAASYTSLVEVRTGKDQVTLWIDTYICRACGYVELFVANRSDLAVLPQADGWVRMDAGPANESR
jgi:predicted nucleic-acid-binding Zn-ribbon protein